MSKRFVKSLDRVTFFSTVLDVILAGITLFDVFYFVAVAVEKICQHKRNIAQK